MTKILVPISLVLLLIIGAFSALYQSYYAEPLEVSFAVVQLPKPKVNVPVTSLNLTNTDGGLVGLPGIITTPNSTIVIEVLQDDRDGCHMIMGINVGYDADGDPNKRNTKDFVKHHGPCNKSDVKYLIGSLIKQLQQYIDHAKKIIKDPAAFSASAEEITAMRQLEELCSKIINELFALIATL